MSKKLLPNRISKTVAPDAMSKIRQAFNLLEEALGDPTPISDEDYKALRKIADKLKRVTDDVYGIAVEYPDRIRRPLQLGEITKDKLFYELCDAIRVLLNAFAIRLEREQNISGAEYFNACNVFEGDIADDIARDATDGQAQNIKAQLDSIDRNRGGGNNKGSENKTDSTPKK